jgi:hypothetical protein
MGVHIPRILMLLVASYGLFYFSYKYETPWSGAYDYYHYYYMYLSPLNPHAATAPWIFRQISAVVTHLVLKSGIYYPNDIQFQDARYDQHVFFAALFTNWIFLVLAAWVAGLIAEHELRGRNPFASLIAGLLCLLAFYVQTGVITGLTEGPSWLLLAVGFLAYLRRARMPLLLVLALSIFQRETIIIALGLIAVFDLLLSRKEKRFRLQICVMSAVCFAAYFLARRLFIPGLEQQTHLGGIVYTLAHFHLTNAIIFQGVISQNTLAIFLAVALVARRHAGLRQPWVPVLLATTAVIYILGLAAGLGNNVGRLVSVLTPVFAGLAAAGLWKIWNRQSYNQLDRMEA